MQHDFPEVKTPWQKVFLKFGRSRAELARELGHHPSKLTKALNNHEGLINCRDQKLILKAAARLKVTLTGKS
jgi:hypothetical protein